MTSTLLTCTSSTRPGSPNAGDTLFETDTKNIITYDGSSFITYQGSIENTLSASLDGTDDHIDCGTNSGLNLSAFTYSCWVKVDDTGYNTVIQRRTAANGTQFSINSEALYFYGGSNVTLIPSGITANTWHHVAMTHTGSEVKGYLNGVPGDSTSTSYTSIASANFYIGKHLTGNQFSFNGLIDEVGVWNEALTDAEIIKIFNDYTPTNLLVNKGSYTSKDNLVGYWRMGDGTGDTDDGSGSPANGDTIGTVKNLANPGTHDGTGSGGATYSSTTPSI
jgi:hypothetical protein